MDQVLPSQQQPSADPVLLQDEAGNQVQAAGDVDPTADLSNTDVCLPSETDSFKRVGVTPSRVKRVVPEWFAGKVSPAFEKHIFWPSPPKK